MGYILAISNNKGGVGKTTTAANLANALANKAKRVLLVDVDSQCNLTSFFASEASLIQARTLYALLDREDVTVETCVQASVDYPRIWILPNNPDTSALEPHMARRADLGWFLLRQKIRDYALANYDYTIIDTPPNLGLFSMQAMIASDFIIVPIDAGSKFSLDGLSKTVSTIEDISTVEGVEGSGRFLRLLINRADRRTSITKVSIAYLTDMYGEKVFQTIIPQNTAIQQAEHMGITVLRHDAKSLGAIAMRALATEIMNLLP